MSNRLEVAMLQALVSLYERGWSQRQIARKLGIDRETVARYLRQLRTAQAKPAIVHTGSNAGEMPKIGVGGSSSTVDVAAKPAIVHTGSDEDAGSKPAISHTGSEEQLSPKPAMVHTGSEGAEALLTGLAVPKPASEGDSSSALGRHSECAAFRELIQSKLDQGLSAQRIWQDLRSEYQFEHSYYSVLRFVRRLTPRIELPFRRLECKAGEECQVDFGTGAALVGSDGKRRRTHVFRMVLSYSRKAYSEAVTQQTTDVFLSCLENAFHYFGGSTRTVVIDNLKAAVTKADWFDPDLNPKIQAFAAHYGTVILPTKPRTPRHKGKVERGVDYVQDNALKGRTFAGLEEENRFLLEWEENVADTRIHGTTRRQVNALFVQVEKAALLPLPVERFPNFREGQRIVHRDGHVEVDKAYYSVPPEYLGRQVWVRWDGRLVRVFNQRLELIASHAKRRSGSFSTHNEHLHSAKISQVERGADALLERARKLDPQIGQWAQAMLADRGLAGIRPLLGLFGLVRKFPVEIIARACASAERHGAYRLRNVRQLAQRYQEEKEELPFLDEHPLIRPLGEYGQRAVDATGAAPLHHDDADQTLSVSAASDQLVAPVTSLFDLLEK